MPLRQQQLVAMVKELCAKIGLPPQQVSGHSFRRGGATFAFAIGVTETLIQRQGGWRSDSYKDYIWLDPEGCASCAGTMGVAIKEGRKGLGIVMDTE
jgi:integrase